MLDVPNFFWDSEPTLHPLYHAVREYLEIKPRIQVLNERCRVFLDLAEILSDSIADTKMSSESRFTYTCSERKSNEQLILVGAFDRVDLDYHRSDPSFYLRDVHGGVPEVWALGKETEGQCWRLYLSWQGRLVLAF